MLLIGVAKAFGCVVVAADSRDDVTDVRDYQSPLSVRVFGEADLTGLLGGERPSS
jgi:hypothetical protein